MRKCIWFLLGRHGVLLRAYLRLEGISILLDGLVLMVECKRRGIPKRASYFLIHTRYRLSWRGSQYGARGRRRRRRKKKKKRGA
jgi:hypothetical protein